MAELIVNSLEFRQKAWKHRFSDLQTGVEICYHSWMMAQDELRKERRPTNQKNPTHIEALEAACLNREGRYREAAMALHTWLDASPMPLWQAEPEPKPTNPDEHSGWTNYETFTVALFVNNNRPQYDQVKTLAAEALTEDGPNIWLSDRLEELVRQEYLQMDEREERNRTDTDYLAHTLLTAALDRVNWQELAKEWLATAQEDAV